MEVKQCSGKMVNGPGKEFARCSKCGRVDYEAYEGDRCLANESPGFIYVVYSLRENGVKKKIAAYRNQYLAMEHAKNFTGGLWLKRCPTPDDLALLKD